MTVTFGPMATTRMACEEAAARQETLLLHMLPEQVVEATVAGAELRLRSARGTIVCRASLRDGG